MLPEIIIHNSISLDGSLTGFMPDMGLHYKIAGDYKPDAHLIGTDTIIAGNEMFGESIPEEIESDFKRPDGDPDIPWWIIVDSQGRLSGMLHTCRRFNLCRDVIVLTSDSTPSAYLSHLEQRNYRYLKSGKVKVDLKRALEQLSADHGIKRIVTDTGSVLVNLLISQGLVSEISLLVYPLIVGEKCYPIFSGKTNSISLKLIRSESFENGCVWNVYRT